MTTKQDAMEAAGLPSPELLRKLIDYNPETGVFTWLPRSSDMFLSDALYGSERKARLWNARHVGKPAFKQKSDKTRVTGMVLKRTLKAHRVAWAIHYGKWPEGEIDHIDGDPTNNCIVNLRVVSRVENCRNRAISPQNKSGHVGVFWRKDISKWVAYINASKGKTKVLGYFENIEGAIAARKAAEPRLGYHDNHGRAIRA